MKRKVISLILSLCMLTSMTHITSAANSGSSKISDHTNNSGSSSDSENTSNTGSSSDSENTSNTNSSSDSESTNNTDNTNGSGSSQNSDFENNSDSSKVIDDSDETSPVFAITPVTSKASSQSIKITWSSENDAYIKKYFVMRRSVKNNAGTGKWKTIGKVKSDGKNGGALNSYIDQLNSPAAQQYEYKICTLSKDQTINTRDAVYADETNEYAVLGSNIKICIDPGHFGTINNNYEYEGADGNFPYSEAKFNLKVGKALQTELKQAYGIDSYMTRTGDSISLTYNGYKYKNEHLDQKNISVRGYTAKATDCDLFLSLHTNSTSRPTRPWSQPKSINKVFVFVNQAAHNSDRGMKIANSIGINLTNYNKETGIQTTNFTTRNRNMAADFSNLTNDAAKKDGTVVHRKSSRGDDYYGVLRGSSAAGVEGILVEHAFHATQIVRKRASSSSDLYESWAECDAYGVAYGYGFADSQDMDLQP